MKRRKVNKQAKLQSKIAQSTILLFWRIAREHLLILTVNQKDKQTKKKKKEKTNEFYTCDSYMWTRRRKRKQKWPMWTQQRRGGRNEHKIHRAGSGSEHSFFPSLTIAQTVQYSTRSRSLQSEFFFEILNSILFRFCWEVRSADKSKFVDSCAKWNRVFFW